MIFVLTFVTLTSVCSEATSRSHNSKATRTLGRDAKVQTKALRQFSKLLMHRRLNSGSQEAREKADLKKAALGQAELERQLEDLMELKAHNHAKSGPISGHYVAGPTSETDSDDSFLFSDWFAHLAGGVACCISYFVSYICLTMPTKARQIESGDFWEILFSLQCLMGLSSIVVGVFLCFVYWRLFLKLVGKPGLPRLPMSPRLPILYLSYGAFATSSGLGAYMVHLAGAQEYKVAQHIPPTILAICIVCAGFAITMLVLAAFSNKSPCLADF